MAKTNSIEKETKIESQINISLEENTNIKLLQKVISSINQLLDDEVTLKLTPSEFIIRCLDKSRFVMVDLTIKSSFFKDFTITKDLLMTIPLSRLHSIFNCYRKTDTISITFDNFDQTLLIELINDISRHYTIPLIQPDDISDPTDLQNPTAMKFDCNITFFHKQLTNILSDLKSLKSMIEITANNNQIIFTNSQNKSQNTITIPTEQLKDISDIETEISSLYSQDTFTSILDLDLLFESNTLHFSAKHPLLLRFSNEDLSINYLIAPCEPEKKSYPEIPEEGEYSEDKEDDEDWGEEESEEEESEEKESEEDEEEYPNLSKCSMTKIEDLANTDLKMLKIKANEQLGLEIKKQARKTTTLALIANKQLELATKKTST